MVLKIIMFIFFLVFNFRSSTYCYFIYVSKNKDKNNDINDTPKSTLREFELGSQRDTSYKPLFEKE